VQELANARLRGLPIPPPWHETSQDLAVRLHRPPELVTGASDGAADLLELPGIPRPRPSLSEVIGVVWTALATPGPHRFVRQEDAALGPALFNRSGTQAQPAVQPDTMADELCRKPLALVQVGDGGWLHEARMPQEAAAGQWVSSLDNAQNITSAPDGVGSWSTG
jgi:hypothetical protein